MAYVTLKLLIFCAIITHINDKHIKFEVSLHLAYCAARRRGGDLRCAPARRRHIWGLLKQD